MFKLRLGLLLIVLTLGPAVAPARADTADEYLLKAALLYKFAQFTEWPVFPTAEFRLCILGQDPFVEATDTLRGKLLKHAPVAVAKLSTADEVKACQAVFVNPPNAGQLRQWMANLKGQPILTISDSPDAWQQGVMILMINEPNRIAFSINLTAARQAGLNFQAQMLQLAREVR
jgi:hypothetical protein